MDKIKNHSAGMRLNKLSRKIGDISFPDIYKETLEGEEDPLVSAAGFLMKIAHQDEQKREFLTSYTRKIIDKYFPNA